MEIWHVSLLITIKGEGGRQMNKFPFRYTTIYDFMNVYGLSLSAKVVWGVIIGKWKRHCRPVEVPYSYIQAAIGITPPTIAAAIKELKNAKVISILAAKGKKSLYTVNLPEQILLVFFSARIEKKQSLQTSEECNAQGVLKKASVGTANPCVAAPHKTLKNTKPDIHINNNTEDFLNSGLKKVSR